LGRKISYKTGVLDIGGGGIEEEKRGRGDGGKIEGLFFKSKRRWGEEGMGRRRGEEGKRRR
jgi:hypothetical protein